MNSTQTNEVNAALSEVEEVKVKPKRRPRTTLKPIECGPKVKRNQSCPCGSGKKAKRCCKGKLDTIRNAPVHQRVEVALDVLLGGTL